MQDIAPDVLRTLYWDEKLSTSEIGKIYGCSKRGIQLLMREQGIPRRSKREGLMNYFLKRSEKDLSVTYSEEEKKLLALAIDLEGCISVTKRKSSQRITGYASMANTKKELCDYIKNLSKMGSIVGPLRKSGNNKDAYMWTISSLFSLKHFLEQIYPYLIAKKRQAILIIQLCDLRIKNYGKPLSEEENRLVQEVHKLNKPGRII